jgi:hypothetical protein
MFDDSILEIKKIIYVLQLKEIYDSCETIINFCYVIRIIV